MGINDLGRITGLSAYEIAVKNGFVGTEKQWLKTIGGSKGETGKNGLNGKDGKDGKDGIDGTGTGTYTKPENGIPKSDLAPNVFEGLGAPAGAWELIEERVLGAVVPAGDKIVFSGLEKYKRIIVEFMVNTTVNNTDNLRMIFNDSTESLYNMNYQLDTIGSVANQQYYFTLNSMVAPYNCSPAMGKMEIVNIDGKQSALFIDGVTGTQSAAYNLSRLKAYGMYHGLPAIKSIQLYGQAYDLKVGTKFVLRGIK